jgi:hypothetical protein
MKGETVPPHPSSFPLVSFRLPLPLPLLPYPHMGIFSFFSKHEPEPPSVDITSQVNRDVEMPKTERVGRDIVYPEEGPQSDVESGAPTLADVNVNTAESSPEPAPDVPPTPMQSGIRLKKPVDEPAPETVHVPQSGVEAIETSAAAPPSSTPVRRTPSGKIEISGLAMQERSKTKQELDQLLNRAPYAPSATFGPNDEVIDNPAGIAIGAGDQPLADGEGKKKAA